MRREGFRATKYPAHTRSSLRSPRLRRPLSTSLDLVEGTANIHQLSPSAVAHLATPSMITSGCGLPMSSMDFSAATRSEPATPLVSDGIGAAALLGKQPGHTSILPAEANPLMYRLSMDESPLSKTCTTASAALRAHEYGNLDLTRRYLPKKLEEGVPDHRDSISRKMFACTSI
ncbi:hypothetical protein PENSPDRAFT_735869 [Peniophora sp. CONT]|nr:hypothetical protein PENSPDRAFT_735869 [Peniophora sp. CONT]